MSRLKPASQNIDVHFFQTRVPGEWKARLVVSKKEVRMFGPSDMRSLMVNVDKFLAIETLYTDVLVHGEEAITARNNPKKISELRAQRLHEESHRDDKE